MNRKTIFLLLANLILIASIGFANPQQNFEKATAAYQAKDFKTAISTYEAGLSEGMISKELYYNLGNAYFREKQYGKAVLNLERALQIAPSDADIQHNLQIVRQELVDDIEQLPPFFLAKWWNATSQIFSSTVWSALAILTMWLTVAGLVLWLIGKQRTQRKRGFLGGLGLLVLTLLFYALGNTRANAEQDSGQAVLISKEMALRSAPDGESKVILDLHEGVKVSIQDQIGDWHKVRLANGEVGWLPKDVLEKI